MNGFTQKGIEAFKSGNKQTAQDFFKQALQENPGNETAWLWLAGTFDDNKTRILCLEKVLAINPDNPAAKKGLAQLTSAEVMPPAQTSPPAAEVPQLPPPVEAPAAPAVEAMLIADDLWPDEPDEMEEMPFKDASESDNLPGGVLDDNDLLAEDDAADTAQPVPIVEEGSIASDEDASQKSPNDLLEAGESSIFIRSLEAKPLPKGRYAILIPGFEDHQIVLKPSSLSRARLFFDGKPVKKEKRSKTYQLTSVEGLIAKVEMRPSLLDPLPQVWVDGEKIILAPSIKWYQWAWMGIPLIALVVLGGAIGAIFGITTLLFNIQIFRSRLPAALRYVFTFLITLAAVAVYLVAKAYLSNMLQGYASV